MSSHNWATVGFCVIELHSSFVCPSIQTNMPNWIFKSLNIRHFRRTIARLINVFTCWTIQSYKSHYLSFLVQLCQNLTGTISHSVKSLSMWLFLFQTFHRWFMHYTLETHKWTHFIVIHPWKAHCYIPVVWQLCTFFTLGHTFLITLVSFVYTPIC